MPEFPANILKFNELRALDLPIGHYAVTSSGPLGIRNIREIGDIDLLLDDELWAHLVKRYPTTVKDGVTTLTISQNIEALGSGSILAAAQAGPSVQDQIDAAEIIDGLRFVLLETVLYFKKIMNRPKDARDIAAIEAILGAKELPDTSI